MKLSVYHTPEEVPDGKMPDCAIAIDVLRATSTMAAAFNAGVEAVQVFSDIDQLLEVSADWPADKRLRAGERGGQRVEGCDLGNSPLDHSPEQSASKRLFMTTTNGTRCLERIQAAPTVLTAALTTRHAVVEYLLGHSFDTVWLVGSGWEGTYSLEDTVCAGAIVHGIIASTHQTFKELAGNDAAIASVSLYLQWQDQLLDLMHYASHGQRLLRLNNTADLQYCAQLDVLRVVPIQQSPGVLVSG
ncbi:2-phosphosulfolactate phosphatase family protein [filamentous cyanobacterium CCP5]|nr:2-phosphosulfolactate phosphatase family protein [filamentous cyanobacterium CCP5]